MAKKKTGIRKLETGNPFNKENRPDDKYVEGDLRVQTIYRILDWYKEGLMRYQIIQLLEEEKNYEIEQINALLLESSGIIYEEFSTQSADVIGLHLRRYDTEIRSLLNKDYNKLSLKIRYKVKSQAFMCALETLHQKERLLNLHSKNTIIRFNQRNNIQINSTEKDQKFDLSSLTLEEKIDFLKLVERCSPTNQVDTSIILRPKETKEEDIIDIQHEEIRNIDQIEKENVLGVDLLPEPTSSNILELKEKLKKTLQQKAKEAFIEAGSKTAKHEREL